MKKLLLLLFFLPLTAQAQWQDVLNQVKDQLGKLSTQNSSVDIAGGLKEALNNGISKQVSKLTATDGFYKNQLVKITFPDEMQKVDKTLRKIGLKKLADDGIKSLNRAAEEAVKEATPIFVNAIKNMSFNDAKSILMGNESAATDYLKGTTTSDLYAQFNPIIQQSIGKVGADKIWTNIIKKYNNLPGTSKVNPDLTDYVTQRALEGVFKMIAVEEKDIRTNLRARSSDLLKKVFALQDRK
ncbi:DUF4197 domain-containing protein [Flavobacterium sp. CYK-55]|uniref:DUF4197 domain-containing protein n=1 Tax=Flavobacterium sp. CYK-55 TaxID=2835529 RepID=UPI001BCE217D|nr:DUF4197 domain-containing protein [Flavobacterium sp. CYK-55]MBS7786918.1 DUF4197 domain-containing protein [Flavobacterium sp. CYK-55]